MSPERMLACGRVERHKRQRRRSQRACQPRLPRLARAGAVLSSRRSTRLPQASGRPLVPGWPVALVPRALLCAEGLHASRGRRIQVLAKAALLIKPAGGEAGWAQQACQPPHTAHALATGFTLISPLKVLVCITPLIISAHCQACCPGGRRSAARGAAHWVWRRPCRRPLACLPALPAQGLPSGCACQCSLQAPSLHPLLGHNPGRHTPA